MDLATKLNLKPGMKVRVVGRPRDVDLPGLDPTTSAAARAVLLFVRTAAELDRTGAGFVRAAREDRIAWVAYPKAGQRGTDLDRDRLAERLRAREGIDPVRQVALDDTWSAMRFRPGRPASPAAARARKGPGGRRPGPRAAPGRK
jgi:hypothetical protein